VAFEKAAMSCGFLKSRCEKVKSPSDLAAVASEKIPSGPHMSSIAHACNTLPLSLTLASSLLLLLWTQEARLSSCTQGKGSPATAELRGGGSPAAAVRGSPADAVRGGSRQI
jgi:hypothetical protein